MTSKITYFRELQNTICYAQMCLLLFPFKGFVIHRQQHRAFEGKVNKLTSLRVKMACGSDNI